MFQIKMMSFKSSILTAKTVKIRKCNPIFKMENKKHLFPLYLSQTSKVTITNYSKTSDLELLALYKTTGNNECIGVLFKRYSPLVYGVCNKYLKDEDASKDAVMQIFEKLLKDINKYIIKEFRPWIYTVAKNHCFIILRSKPKEISRQENTFMEKQAFLHLPVESSETIQEKELQLQQLDQAVSQLDEHQRICIKLFFIQVPLHRHPLYPQQLETQPTGVRPWRG